ncbi:hypothetical protein Bcell_0754 [Evansella cellulosilytica DSM 2522]|uniref:Uncharacterized protein n=2 Tax=Evansella TaxID=2837485 RepID=E6U031_EVAC2|nr:hypothetical protein Bcell_0754 [Evansella cellulosilytica DSM 2522]
MCDKKDHSPRTDTFTEEDKKKAEMVDTVTTGGIFSLFYFLGEMIAEPRKNKVSWFITITFVFIFITILIFI